MTPSDPDESVRRIEITGDLDRHAVEALRLEVLRLARRHGVTVENLRIQESGDSQGAPLA